MKLQVHQVTQTKEELAYKDALGSKLTLIRLDTEKKMELLKVLDYDF